ncbi:MAG: hypothetical protein V3R99_07335 [Thermoguttaceae bacterium]
MSHPLETKINTLRTRVRRLVAIHGISRLVAVVLGTLILLGSADYLIRFQDPGLKVICSLLVLASLGWTAWRYLYQPLATQLSDVALASRIERRFPQFEDRLVSSVEFLKQPVDDPIAGSAALRRAVIARTEAETDRLDFSEVLDRRPSLRAAVTSAAVCLLGAILVLSDPLSSQIALARLANPLGSVAWPRKNHLAFRRPPDRVARGQAFEVELVDARGARLPSPVTIHYRIEQADGTISEETEILRPAGHSALVRRESVIRPFSYRAEGGDDPLMDFHEVAVVEPPAVESASIRLIPPAYTGWPTEKTQKHVRALIGTRMRIVAKANKPLQSAVLSFDDGGRFPGVLSSDGYSFQLPAADTPAPTIQRSGSYRLELTDRENLRSDPDTRWEIHALADAPPSVVVERPTGSLFVTPNAEVPLRITAKDDLALRSVTLVFSRTDGPPQPDRPPDETELPLYNGPEKVKPRTSGGLARMAESDDRRVIERRWQLADLQLAPGMQLTFHVRASDYRPQLGNSEPRRLTVITKEQLQDRLAERQGRILAELARVLKMQLDGRSQVGSLEIRLTELGRFEQVDVDRLQAAELNQRQVRRTLTDRADGVPMHILALLDDLENNKVDSPDVRRRMEGLLDDIDRLDREHLPLIGRELTTAIKAAQVRLQQGTDSPEQPDSPEETVSIGDPMSEAGRQQDQVIAALEQMLARLGQWDNYRRFHRQIGQLLRDQKEVAGRTTEVGRKTLTRDLKDLNPQEAADLKILAGRQLELARRLGVVQQAMQQAVGDLRQTDPLAAETVADALAAAQRLAITGQMHTSSGHLAGNRIGQAIDRQQQIAEDLQEVLDVLANRREHELVRLIKKLEEAEHDLAELQRQQEELQKQRPADADRQKQLEEETQRMARRLERLLADQAAKTTRDAAGQMNRAGDAAKTLDEARQQVAQRRRQAQAELAMEQLARMEDALKHLRRQQQTVLDETRRYDRLQEGQGRLTRGQLAGLGDLARLERMLQTDCGRLGEKLAGAGVFRLALSGAARSMGRAAGMLDRRQTGMPTQETEQHAAGRLDLVLEALKEEPPEDDDSNSGGGAGQGTGDLPGEAIQALAQLKLLKLLQVEINLRSRQLQQSVADDGPTEQQRLEYAALSAEQGQLADLVLQLMKVVAPPPEENPETLPDVQEENQDGQPPLPGEDLP